MFWFICTIELEITYETVLISVEKIEYNFIDVAIGIENLRSRVIFIPGEFPTAVYFKKDESGM